MQFLCNHISRQTAIPFSVIGQEQNYVEVRLHSLLKILKLHIFALRESLHNELVTIQVLQFIEIVTFLEATYFLFHVSKYKIYISAFRLRKCFIITKICFFFKFENSIFRIFFRFVIQNKVI